MSSSPTPSSDWQRSLGYAVRWAVAVGVVLGVGVIGFPREYPELNFWSSLYFTIRLFVFEYDLPHFPTAWPLVGIVFAAPLIALTAAGSVINRLLKRTPALRTRWLADHVLVCGVGRTGKVIAATLRRRGVRVVGVDLGPPEQLEDWSRSHRVSIVYGSFFSHSLLRRAGARRARSILFTSGDDLANLEGAVGSYDWLRHQRFGPRIIWTHVANEKLRQTARQAVRTTGPLRLRFFDTYRIAARRMVAKFFDAERRRGIHEVTVLGCGKFGLDLLDVLLNDLRPDERLQLRVIDRRDRSGAVRALADAYGLGDRVTFEQADLHDLELVDERDRAFFLCTDDDLGNLTGALMLARNTDATSIFVRMGVWPLSAIAEHLGEDRGVTFVNINDLVAEGIGELPGVFSPPTGEELPAGQR